MESKNILNELDFAIFICDIKTKDLLFINKKARSLLGIPFNQTHFDKCYQVLQNTNRVCPFCNIHELDSKKTCYFNGQHNAFGENYLMKDHLITYEGREAKLEIAFDLTELEDNYTSTKEQLDSERLFMSYIQKLILSENFEESMTYIMNCIVESFDGDRAYLFEFDYSTGLAHNTYEQCVPGVSPEIDNLQNVPIEVVDVWIQAFENQNFIYIEDVSKIKGDASRQQEYEILSAQGIDALLAVPIRVHEKLIGFIGVDNPKSHEHNPKVLVNLAYFIANELNEHAMNEKLHELSYYDYLTHVRNRNSYNAYISYSLNRVYKNLGIIYLDLNGLKMINDTYGHTYGDQALFSFVNILFKHFPQRNIYRISGDEFVVICTDWEEVHFSGATRRLQQDLTQDGEEIAAFGAIWESQSSDIKETILRAEKSMYVHKKRFYESLSYDGNKRMPLILKSLMKDIRDGQLFIHLQPKANLTTGEVYGAEALIRKRDKYGNTIFPYEFITLYEQDNAISKIDFFVLEEVCQLLQKWAQNNKKTLNISVNMSRITLAEPSFIKDVVSICERYDIDYSQIEFEITETAQTLDKKHLIVIVSELKALGFGVSLDDMGSDHSTLAMLPITGIDTVKIDRSLTQTVDTNEEYSLMLKHIISLCHDLGKVCVAEGVETKEQAILLKSLGCDSMQGYLLDKPIPVELFEDKYL